MGNVRVLVSGLHIPHQNTFKKKSISIIHAYNTTKVVFLTQHFQV